MAIAHFSALPVVVSTFRKSFGCLIFGLSCSATWVLTKHHNSLSRPMRVDSVSKDKDATTSNSERKHS